MTRDVVIVTIDSLRADHCGFLGSEHDLTPTMDTLADSGVVFENAIAPGPRTPSSVPETFTGVTPSPYDGEWTDWQRRRQRIYRHMRRHRTLAERFEREGYITLGFSANPWTQGTGFEAGFETYVKLDGATAVEQRSRKFGLSFVDKLLAKTNLENSVNWFNKRDWFVTWQDLFDSFTATKVEDQLPIFAWFFLLDTHEPYLAPKDYRTENSLPGMIYSAWKQHKVAPNKDGLSPYVDNRIRMAYRDAVRSVDGFVESLLTELDSRNPLIIVHADHGEAFGEHGTFGHQPQLFEENLHVPLLVHNVGVNRSIQRPISLGSLPDLVGHLIDNGDGFNPERFCSDVVLSTTETGAKVSVRTQNWKYIHSDDRSRLYNLVYDPKETNDVSHRRDRLVDHLRGLLEQREQHLEECERISLANNGFRDIR